MSKINEESIRSTLEKIIDSSTDKTLNEFIDNIVIQDDKVIFSINADPTRIKDFEILKEKAVVILKKELNLNVTATLTSNLKESSTSKSPNTKKIKGVKKTILIASGKGGVGKSTVAFNLAIALANLGHKVGIVDADIYGPSLPKLSGLTRKPVLENNLMIPHKKFGIKLMSVGYLVNQEEALIWRGPLTTKMLYQLIRLTNWEYDGSELDYLIIDSPPGTGDVHLSLAENYQIDGALVITTPQALATSDAAKALAMFKKTNINVLGIVENMSFYEPLPNNKVYLFGQGGGKKLAKAYKVDLLMQIPINSDIVDASDKGKPITYYKPNHPISYVYKTLAMQIN